MQTNFRDGIIDSTAVSRPRPNIAEAEVTIALTGMKTGKAAGSTKVVAEMFGDGGDAGVKCLTELCNMTVSVGHLPLDGQSSTLIPVLKGKSDRMECV
jgi:hypothetical protein